VFSVDSASLRRGAAAVLGGLMAGCALVAAPDRHPLPLRDRLRPDPEVWELVRHPADELDVQDMQRWVEGTDLLSGLATVGTLAAVAAQTTWRAGRLAPRGGETGVNWSLPRELAAAEIGGLALGTRPPLAAALAPSQKPWRPVAPAPPTGPELRYVVADLHVHTAWSHDAVASVREILLSAIRQGIDVLAITDHERLTYREATAVLADLVARGEASRPLLLVPGVEVSTTEGHVLAYFVERTVPHAMDPAATLQTIRAQGGLAVLAHPFRPGSGIHGPPAYRLPWDGAEVISGADLYPTSWIRALDEAPGFGSARLGSSDAHFSAWVGSAVTILAVTEVTANGVRDAMMLGRTWPVARSVAVDAWATALGSPAVRGGLRALSAPFFAVEWLRLQAARLLLADDVRIRTNWTAAAEEVWSLWRATRLPGRLRDPFDPVAGPLRPEGIAVRWGPIVAGFDLPVGIWGYDREGRPLRVPREPEPRPAELDPASPVLRLWPAEWVASLSWGWVF
jgi:predicted metal-dependent phosphoesterase TrpH